MATPTSSVQLIIRDGVHAGGLLRSRRRSAIRHPSARRAGAQKLTGENQVYEALLLIRSRAGKAARGVLQFPF
jgi:hypothetical protein